MGKENSYEYAKKNNEIYENTTRCLFYFPFLP